MTEQEDALNAIRNKLYFMIGEGYINKNSYDYIKALVDAFEQPFRFEPHDPHYLKIHFEELQKKWEKVSALWDFLVLEGYIGGSVHDGLMQNWRLLHPHRITHGGAAWIADNLLQLPQGQNTEEVISELRHEKKDAVLNTTNFKHANFLVFEIEADELTIRQWQEAFNDKYHNLRHLST